MPRARTVRRFALVAVCVLGTSATAAFANDTSLTAAQLMADQARDWQVEVISDELAYPWAIRPIEGGFVMTEGEGNIVHLVDGELRRFALQSSDPVVHEGGSGLMGLALAGDFAQSGKAWLYYSYRSDTGARLNKLVTAEFDGQSWRETAVLLDGIPGHRLYNGGRIAFGPDGYLYVTTGWTADPALPQDLESLAGKILRMTPDGAIPDDNPFAGSYIWSYGHRNPQGLAWNSDGVMYAAEHGQSGNDELNLITAGANYGWPAVEGNDSRDGMQSPIIHAGRNTWAPSAIAMVDDVVLIAALRAKALLAYPLEASETTEVLSTNERYRDVLPLGDALYVITTNRSPRSSGPNEGDRLLRITP
ncbi:sorbosone dehydrogenase family protein [Thalassospira sp. HJ]|uniref:PQQ-dependent sugar dehydrogenase n=1 Tax=Thalassospira sp. HJ TaxID=1616823 RepID=UPI000B26E86E|nr:PQQ-dependent sugar dehydrogenase [Thalassospira sp. HJ]